MPSHALVLVSRAYFPEVQADQYAQTVYSSIIEALGDDTIQVVSAVVDDVASTKDVKNAQGHPTRGVSLFLASEDEGASIHTFEDKVDRNISLGRAWKSQGDPANQETIDDGWVPTGDWKELLGGGGSSTSPSETTTIVPAQNVQSAILVGKGDFFAIDWPAQLFPKATVYGIPASITPFLTGYPITLSHNDKILKNGGVAIGFNRKQAQVHITHPRLKLLGEALTVTKAQGNILIALDEQAATYALLERIRQVIHKDLVISKDIQLFGELHHRDESGSSVLPIIKITGGDPGKGSIALNGSYRVREGDMVQLYYDDPDATTSDASEPAYSESEVVKVFRCIGADTGHSYESTQPVTDAKGSQVRVFPNLFAGASCAGVILGTPKRTWVDESIGCQVVMK